MAKKIYDIKPPKVAHKTEKELKEFLGNEKKKKRGRRKKEGGSVWWSVSIAVLIIVLAAGVYLFFKLPKADIQVWPKINTLSFQQTVTADKSAGSVDVSKEVIPAQYFEISKNESQDFPATGNADNEGQASGTITVYNKYSPATVMTFRSGTHFMSDSGKLFVAMQEVSVPAAKKSGGKITPGSTKIKVQAVEGGDSYNIAPSNFSIPGLKGTSYYYSVYGTSAVAMAGGYTGKIKKVTDDDIQSANDVLVKKATADAISDLKNQIPSGYILLDNAASSSTTFASTKTKSGTVADNFTYQVTVKVGGLAFKKSDLDQFAQNYIVSQLPQGKSLLENSYQINYSVAKTNVSGGTEALALNFSSGVYQNIDKNSLVSSLLGKNARQVNDVIANNSANQVSKVKVIFWPFWVTTVPENQSAVSLELKFQ